MNTATMLSMLKVDLGITVTAYDAVEYFVSIAKDGLDWGKNTHDTTYYDIFGRVSDTLGAPDLMIAECGQYDPSWAKIHMFPEQTVQAGVDAKASWVIPVHWGTFCICNTDWDDSIIRASESSKTSGLNLATPRIGQTVDYDEISSFTEAWWEEYA